MPLVLYLLVFFPYLYVKFVLSLQVNLCLERACLTGLSVLSLVGVFNINSEAVLNILVVYIYQ